MAHSYTADTTTYCRVRTFTRSAVFEDSDLIDGNLEFWLDWTSGPIKPFLGWAAGESLRDKIIGIGACGTTSQLAWTTGLGNILVDGNGKAYGASSGVAYISATGSNGTAPWTRTTLDLSCRVTLGSGGAGLAWRLESENNTFGIYLQTSSLRLKVEKRVNPSFTTVQTGTTALVQGNTYLLRVTCDADGNWETFIDGVSQGTFTDNALSIRCKWGLVTRDTDSRIYDVEGAASTTCPATSYDVINDSGVVVASGAVTASQTKIVVPDSALVQRDGRGPYGGYKLRLYGASVGNYGTAKGNTTFTRVVSSNDFADKPLPFTAPDLGATGEWDVELRAFFGLGATRFAMDVGTPATPATYMQTNYVDRAHLSRPRYNIGHFRQDNTGGAAAITAYVAANKAVFQAWEPRNEPEATNPVTFAEEQAYFYDAIKAGDPDAIVLGPNPVTYNDYLTVQYTWIQEFLAAGGAEHLDGLSVHGYNCTNGDIAMSKRLLARIKAIADSYDLPLWQTEQSFQNQLGNLYDPGHALRWTAVQLMVQECYGIPLERNVLWYDYEHGFAGYTTFWMDKTSAYSVPVLVRTMVDEIGDRTFASEYDLGDWADVYVCPKWTGTDGSATVGVLAQSKGMPDVRFYLTGATSVTAVDAFGNDYTLTRDSDNVVAVETSDLPTWLRVPTGVGLTLVATDWDAGTNLATTATVTTDASATTYNRQALVSQTLENQYEFSSAGAAEATGYPYQNNSATFPQTVTVTLPEAVTVARLVLVASPIWQTLLSTPTDFDIDVYNGTTWTTVHTETPDTSTTSAFVSDVLSSKTTFDSWYNPRTVWDVTFDAQSVTAVRVVIRDTSWGGHETEDASHAVWGGPPGGANQVVTLQGLRLYDGTPTFDPDRPRFNLTVTCSG